MRDIKVTKNFINSENTSVLYESGNTKVLITVSISDRAPRWLENSDKGWLTAEYNMLPGSSDQRVSRKSFEGGRSKEISRLIGRSLRSVCDLGILNGYSITVDCDVLDADGGTRTASITGGTIALCKALKKIGKENAVKNLVAAISVGVYKEGLLLDLNYEEDSNAECDVNIVMNEKLDFIEIQGTGEEKAFSKEQFNALLDLAESGIKDLFKLQNEIINSR